MRAIPRPSRITILAVCLAAVAVAILVIGCMRAMDAPDRHPGPVLAETPTVSEPAAAPPSPDTAPDAVPVTTGVGPDPSTFSHMVEPLSARLFIMSSGPAGQTIEEKPLPAATAPPAPAAPPAAAVPAPAAPETAPRTLAALTPPPAAPTEKTAQKPERAAPAASPRTVLVVGDSFAVGIGMTMADSLRGAKNIRLDQKGKTSSGLDNVKFHNWGKTLEDLLSSAKPDALVIMIGGNDAQNGPGNETWAENYRQKASDFLGIAAKRRLPVYWVALPPMRDATLNAKVKTANTAMRAACEAGPDCRFIDSWDLFADAKGDYAAEKSLGGKNVKLRGNDGVHFTMAGYRLLSDRVVDGFAPKLEAGNTP